MFSRLSPQSHGLDCLVRAVIARQRNLHTNLQSVMNRRQTRARRTCAYEPRVALERGAVSCGRCTPVITEGRLQEADEGTTHLCVVLRKGAAHVTDKTLDCIGFGSITVR